MGEPLRRIIPEDDGEELAPDTGAAEREERIRKLEKKEHNRLRRLYKELPPKRKALADGMIAEAARLRARCDVLWDELAKSGEWELFSQSPDTEPYERERPASRIYTATNKAYQNIIKQLDDMLPQEIADPIKQNGGFNVD